MKLTKKQIAVMFITNTLREFMSDQDYAEYSPMIIAAFQGLGIPFEELYDVNYVKEELEQNENNVTDELNKIYKKGLKELLEQSKKNMANFMRRQHKENNPNLN